MKRQIITFHVKLCCMNVHRVCVLYSKILNALNFGQSKLKQNFTRLKHTVEPLGTDTSLLRTLC